MSSPTTEVWFVRAPLGVIRDGVCSLGDVGVSQARALARALVENRPSPGTRIIHATVVIDTPVAREFEAELRSQIPASMFACAACDSVICAPSPPHALKDALRRAIDEAGPRWPVDQDVLRALVIGTKELDGMARLHTNTKIDDALRARGRWNDVGAPSPFLPPASILSVRRSQPGSIRELADLSIVVDAELLYADPENERVGGCPAARLTTRDLPSTARSAEILEPYTPARDPLRAARIGGSVVFADGSVLHCATRKMTWASGHPAPPPERGDAPVPPAMEDIALRRWATRQLMGAPARAAEHRAVLFARRRFAPDGFPHPFKVEREAGSVVERRVGATATDEDCFMDRHPVLETVGVGDALIDLRTVHALAVLRALDLVPIVPIVLDVQDSTFFMTPISLPTPLQALQGDGLAATLIVLLNGLVGLARCGLPVRGTLSTEDVTLRHCAQRFLLFGGESTYYAIETLGRVPHLDGLVSVPFSGEDEDVRTEVDDTFGSLCEELCALRAPHAGAPLLSLVLAAGAEMRSAEATLLSLRAAIEDELRTQFVPPPGVRVWAWWGDGHLEGAAVVRWSSFVLDVVKCTSWDEVRELVRRSV